MTEELKKCEPCPRGELDKPEPTCANRHQCWEPCGLLGKSAAHARPASPELTAAIQKAIANTPRYHTAQADCWCEPDIDYVDPDTGTAVYVHRGPQ
jgi:hypothetical protein